MSSRKVENSSVKSSGPASIVSATSIGSSYYWTCDSCRYKNSNYSDKCLRCSTPKVGPVSLSTRTAGSTKQKSQANTSQQPNRAIPQSSSIISRSSGKSSPNDKLRNIQSSSTARNANTPVLSVSTRTSTPYTSEYASKSTTSNTRPISSFKPSTASAPGNTRIIPISISPSANRAQQVVRPPLSSPSSLSPNQINLRKTILDGNSTTSKPRSTSLSVDKFQQQESLLNQRLSPQRKAVSTYNVVQQSIPQHVIEALKAFIKDP